MITSMPRPSFATDRHGIGRSGGGKRAALERFERARANLAARLLHCGAAFHEARFQALQAPAVAYSSKRCRPSFWSMRSPSNSRRARPRPNAEDIAPVGNVIEQRDLLRRGASGSCHGTTITIEPSLMRLVFPAMYESNWERPG